MNTFKLQGDLDVFWMKDLQADYTIKYGVRYKEQNIWTSKMSFLKKHWEQIDMNDKGVKELVLMQVGRFFEALSNFSNYAAANGGEIAKEKDLVN